MSKEIEHLSFMVLAISALSMLATVAFYKTIESRNKQIKYLLDLLDKQQKNNDVVMDYCIKHILNEYVRKEDFENAARAKKILDNLQQLNDKFPTEYE